MPAADPTEGLTDGDLDSVLAPVAETTAIALAVSGGADSLALLDGVDRWRRQGSRPDVVVLTVDHGLRPGSADEAARVAAVAAGRGLRARVLTVTGPRPRSDIEAAARQARYRLLVGATREAGASHLLLAHHRDDQAETFLMRVQRGSGVFGLAAMRRTVECDGIVIFRPFLDTPRSRLVATTVAAGLEPVDDPMNRDPRFLRARIRAIMPALAGAGIGAAELAATAARFAVAAEEVDASTDRLIAAATTVDAFATIRIAAEPFRAATEDVRIRLLVRVLMAIGGEPYPPRFQRLKALHDALLGHSGGRLKRTLGGVVAEIRGGSLVFNREWGRIGLPERAVGPGFAGVWDGRFRIDIAADAPAGIVLSALGEAGRRAIGPLPRRMPIATVAAQPAIWRHGELMCAPTLPAAGPAGCRPAARAFQVVGDRLITPLRFPRFLER